MTHTNPDDAVFNWRNIRWFFGGLLTTALVTIPLIFEAGGWHMNITDQLSNLNVQIQQINSHLENEDVHIETERRQLQWLIEHSPNGKDAPEALHVPVRYDLTPLRIADRKRTNRTIPGESERCGAPKGNPCWPLTRTSKP